MARKAIVAALLALSGCAQVTDTSGFEAVQAYSRPALGQAPTWVRSESDAERARAEIATLLKKPLDADGAVRIAMLANRNLRAAYAELGIAEADLVQANRISNPTFSFKRLSREADLDIERSIAIKPLELVLLPFATAIEERRFERAKMTAAQSVLRTAADAQRAWYAAVAAAEIAAYAEAAGEAARARVELARRMAEVGNWSVLDYAREQVFYAESTMRIARIRHRATAARERLARSMGLWGPGERFTLPARVPALPKEPRAAGDIEKNAISERLDVRIAKAETESLSKSLGLTQAVRFVNALELAGYRNDATGQRTQTGYEISVEVPIFDWGSAKVAKAEHLYMQAVDRLAAVAIAARADVREAYSAYRTAYDLSRHYTEEILPLRRKIGEEMVLRYNGMLIGVFELLSDLREQTETVVSAIEAKRDFWLADVDLKFVAVADVGGAIRLEAKNGE